MKRGPLWGAGIVTLGVDPAGLRGCRRSPAALRNTRRAIAGTVPERDGSARRLTEVA